MRWLFLIVLSLNLAYIAWEINKSPADSYENIRSLKNVQPIVLLSELKQDAQTDLEVTAQSTIEQSSSQREVKTESTSSEQSGAAQNAVEQQNIPEEAEPVEGEVAVADNKVPEPTEVLQAVPPQAASCYTLGPFRDLDKLRSLTREIKSYVVTADFRGQEEKEQPLYWVYVKPEKNYKQAVATGKRLKAKKIKDFYIISEGEKINGLSLGYFRNKEGANGLVKKVKNLGFDVTLEPVIKTHTIYWLDYQLVGDTVIPEAIFDKYLQFSKKDKISRLSRDCDS